MKKTFYFLLFLISLTNGYSQRTFSNNRNSPDDFTKDFTERNNDPRIYVEVFNILKNNKIPIWKYSKIQKLPNQLRQIVDATGKIQIEFNKKELSKNRNFKGNITIEGKIVNSDGGEAPIEVFPYSMIGEDKTKIGLTNRPSKEIATIFVNLLIESFEAKSGQDKFISKLKNIIDYIGYFKSSGKEAESAFLSFILLDHISLNNIEEELKNIAINIDRIVSSKSSEDKIQFLTTEDYSSLIDDIKIKPLYERALLQFNKLTQIKGTFINKVLFNNEYSDEKEETIKNALIKNKPKLVDSTSIKASEIIYRNLDYATINLKKERAKEGDYLYLYVVLEENTNPSPNSKIIKKILPIGSYELRNTRWQVKVADSFLLINRINQPDASLSENENISPSNFKGAPGVSLLLTWRRDGGKKNKFINFLEPSLGVNVSYVDFNRNDDVEIGTGLILGFFNNKIFLSSGINLNNTGNNENTPYYFGIGFSFANLVGKHIKK